MKKKKKPCPLCGGDHLEKDCPAQLLLDLAGA